MGAGTSTFSAPSRAVSSSSSRAWSCGVPPGSGNSESLGAAASCTRRTTSRTAITGPASSTCPSRSLTSRVRCSLNRVGAPSTISISVGAIASRPRSCSSSSANAATSSCFAVDQQVSCRISRRATNSSASACSTRSISSIRVSNDGGMSSHS
ncbi:hypothetical protein X942_5556 [Burkholderia pseudomallei MSHR5596]|nr:hypothetical protein X942_5556 [Burkholderia pseudomallei MSHR5596]